MVLKVTFSFHLTYAVVISILRVVIGAAQFWHLFNTGTDYDDLRVTLP